MLATLTKTKCHTHEPVLPGQRNADIRGRPLSMLGSANLCAPPPQVHETRGKMLFYAYEFEGAGSEFP